MATNKIIFGISGPQRSGKHTVARLIANMVPSAEILTFAEPIKEMLRVGLGLSGAELSGDLKDSISPIYQKTPRQMMQTLGVEWGRNLIRPDIWIQAAHARILKSTAAVIIVADVRTDAEANFIRANGGYVLHIEGRGKWLNDHDTEKAPKKDRGRDRIILNDGSSAALQYAVISAIGDLINVSNTPPDIRNCKAKQIGSEFHCDECGLVWDRGDPDRPKCLPSVTKRNVPIRYRR